MQFLARGRRDVGELKVVCLLEVKMKMSSIRDWVWYDDGGPAHVSGGVKWEPGGPRLKFLLPLGRYPTLHCILDF
jgi:hypothetical protein